MSFFGIIGIITFVFLGFCSADLENDQGADNASVTAKIAIEMLQVQQSSRNILLSPTSIHSVLQVLHVGARGKTAAEIESLLGPGYASSGEMDNIENNAEGRNNESFFRSKTQFFYKKGIKIEKNFQQKVENDFKVELIEVDFSKPESSSTVNDWLSDISDEQDGENVHNGSDIFLVNTISIRQQWNDPFHPMDTTEGTFYTDKDKSINMRFMVKRYENLIFGKNEVLGAKWIHLPYKLVPELFDMKMILVLPVKRFELNKLISKLKVEDFYEIVKEEKPSNISIVLPQFEVTARFPVKTGLQKLGIQEIFSNNANLTGITKSDGPLKVTQIIGSSNIRVDEKKTTAESETVGNINFHRGTLDFPPDASFVADEPFLFFILNKKIPCFVGVIGEPKQINNKP